MDHLRRYLPVGLGVVLLMLFLENLLWKWNWGGIPDMGDLLPYFLPFWRFFRSSLLDGQLPLWMDSQELGFPFLYNPQCSLFYLPNYLLLFPLQLGVRLYLQFPFVLMFVGFYLVFRRHRFGVWYSVLSSALLAINGVIVGLFSMTTVLHTLAWLPWLLLVFGPGRSRWHGWGMVLVLSQSFLAGAWDFWLFLVPLAFLAERGWLLGWWELFRGGGRALAVVIPQVWMTMNYLPLTIRKDSVSISETLFWSSGWHHLLGLVSPNIQQSSLGHLVWFEVLGARPGWTLSTYLSASLVTLLPLGIVWLFLRNRLLLAFCAFLLLGSMSGSIQGMVVFFQQADISIPVRYPDKLLPILLVALSFYALRGFPPLLRVWYPRKVSVVSRLAIWPATALAGFPFAREWFLDRCAPAYRADVDVIVGQRLLYEYFTTEDAVIFGLYVLGVLLLIALLRRFHAVIVSVVLLGVVDVSLAGTKWGGLRTLNETMPPEVLDVLGEKELRMAHLDAYVRERGGSSAASHLEFLGKREGFVQLAGDPDAGVKFGWLLWNGMNVLPLRSSRVLSGLWEVQPDSVRAEIMWRSGVSWLLGDTSRIKAMMNDSLRCYQYGGRNAACGIENGGLARWHERMIWSDSTKPSVIRMLATERDRNAAYLLAEPGDVVPESKLVDRPFRTLDVHGTVGEGVRSYTVPDGHGQGVLVVTSSHHPDWIAQDDRGGELPVVIADYALTGVLVPPGVDQVRLRFSTRRLWVGCLAGFVLMVGMIAGFSERCRRLVCRP